MAVMRRYAAFRPAGLPAEAGPTGQHSEGGYV